MEKNLGALAAFGLVLFLVFTASFNIATDSPADFTFVNSTEPQTLDPAKYALPATTVNSIMTAFFCSFAITVAWLLKEAHLLDKTLEEA